MKKMFSLLSVLMVSIGLIGCNNKADGIDTQMKIEDAGYEIDSTSFDSYENFYSITIEKNDVSLLVDILSEDGTIKTLSISYSYKEGTEINGNLVYASNEGDYDEYPAKRYEKILNEIGINQDELLRFITYYYNKIKH